LYTKKFIYIIIDKQSFDNLNNWIKFIKNNSVDNSILILCGNKVDLEKYNKNLMQNYRKVSKIDVKKLALTENVEYFEISAKTGENINNMLFSAISRLQFFEQFQNNERKNIIKELGKIYL